MKGTSNKFDNTELGIVFNDPSVYILLGFVHQAGQQRAFQSFEIVEVISSPRDIKNPVHPGTMVLVLQEHI